LKLAEALDRRIKNKTPLPMKSSHEDEGSGAVYMAMLSIPYEISLSFNCEVRLKTAIEEVAV
jgi:hypothetical protein